MAPIGLLRHREGERYLTRGPAGHSLTDCKVSATIIGSMGGPVNHWSTMRCKGFGLPGALALLASALASAGRVAG